MGRPNSAPRISNRVLKVAGGVLISFTLVATTGISNRVLKVVARDELAPRV